MRLDTRQLNQVYFEANLSVLKSAVGRLHGVHLLSLLRSTPRALGEHTHFGMTNQSM